MGQYDEKRSAPGPLRDKRGLVNRVRRLRGQVDAIERALAGGATCSDLLQRITAARGAALSTAIVVPTTVTRTPASGRGI